MLDAILWLSLGVVFSVVIKILNKWIDKKYPKRTWVGLTDAEQQELYDRWVRTGDGWGLFYILIEAKLKEKNT